MSIETFPTRAPIVNMVFTLDAERLLDRGRTGGEDADNALLLSAEDASEVVFLFVSPNGPRQADGVGALRCGISVPCRARLSVCSLQPLVFCQVALRCEVLDQVPPSSVRGPVRRMVTVRRVVGFDAATGPKIASTSEHFWELAVREPCDFHCRLTVQVWGTNPDENGALPSFGCFCWDSQIGVPSPDD